MSAGFVKLRRGILEHYRDGKVSAYEFHIYILLILEASYETGVWHGSAEKLSIVYRIPSRTCRDVLAKLHQKGYIRRFHSPGKHGNYPVLINKYECRDGAGNEIHLNASKSNDWRHPNYDLVMAVPGECRDGATVQEVRTKNEELKPAQTRRVIHSPEQVRQIEAKQKRLDVKAQVSRELYVGSGPVCAAPELWDQVKALGRKKTL